MKQKYTMDSAKAQNTLQNILKASGNQLPDVPGSGLSASLEAQKRAQEAKARSKSVRILLVLTMLVFVLVLLAPLFFRKSAFHVASVHNQTSLSVVQHHMDDNIVYITFAGGEIDYDEITIKSIHGSVDLLSYDALTETICFQQTGDELNIYVPDLDGHILQLLFTPE